MLLVTTWKKTGGIFNVKLKKRTQGSTFYYKHGDIKLSCTLHHEAATTRPKVCMFQEQNYDMLNPEGLKERVMECEGKSTRHEESAAKLARRKKAFLSFVIHL